LAHKAINLATELSNSEKRVAGAIVDHFNRKTGQCDPSLNRIAELIGMSPRTVIRAANRLHKLGFIRRVRHGGHFHRNSYEPVWLRFLQAEADWNARRNSRRSKNPKSEMSSCLGQACQFEDDNADHQTLQRNLSKETFTTKSCSSTVEGASKERISLARKDAHRALSSHGQFQGTPASRDAARDAAEGRWNRELLDRCRDQPALYGQIIEAIDSKLMNGTTEAELRLRGSGLRYLMNALLARDPSLNDWLPAVIEPGGYQKSSP
jgi:DNA-binding transcriptional regulator YhcF (GntR family)